MSITTVGEIAIRIFTGLSKHGRSVALSDDQAQAYRRDSVPLHVARYISSSSLQDGSISYQDDASVTVLNSESILRYSIEPGDVLVVCRGTQLRSVVAPQDAASSVIGSSLIAVRLDPAVLLPELFNAYVNCSRVVEELVRMTRSNTDSLSVSARHIAALRINVPAADVQRRLVDACSAVADYSELTKTLVDYYQSEMEGALLSHLGE